MSAQTGDRVTVSRRMIRALAGLAVLGLLLGVTGILFTVVYVNTNNHKFCQVIGDVVPVPRPADPAANPSRMAAHEQYERAVSLGRSLGC